MKKAIGGGVWVGVGVGAIILLLVVSLVSISPILGVDGFGPIRHTPGTVTGKHVDYGGSGESRSSHYIVATSGGTFEVDNGWLLGVWNADELYGRIEIGKTYTFKTKGNRVVNFFMQQYPYVIGIE